MSDSATSTSLTEIAQEFIALRDRHQHPAGSFDRKGRWYPDEYYDCCHAIRSPSAAYPYSLLTHCRTVAHVAAAHGVDASAVRKEVRRLEPPAKPTRLGGTYYKAVAVTTDGRLLSIFDGATEYRLGETVRQAVRTGHGGGYYVYPTADAAANASVPASSALRSAPRAVLAVEVSGQYTVYPCSCRDCTDSRRYYGGLPQDHDKIAFSRLTPVSVVKSRV